mmetsp:Transcript_3653/g.6916  ORF Transcript_3653/g.6916 Transcript_3653/m.6916 type:complete len:189 (-) Transcript_3653:294-860(-)
MSKAEWQRKCASVLKVLKAHKHGWVFGEPVDAVKLQIPDYHEIIKRPMDLGTVKENLDNGTITSPEMFKDDVLLTFQNAMTYNPSHHDVHIMAKTLKELFMSKWEPIESSVMEKWRMEQVARQNTRLSLLSPEQARRHPGSGASFSRVFRRLEEGVAPARRRRDTLASVPRSLSSQMIGQCHTTRRES